MSDSAFAPPRGDAGALADHASALGRSAAGLSDQVAQVRRGAALTQLALLNSSSALRIDELRKGIRGLDHELTVLRSAGEHVADVVRDRAAALARLGEDLDRLRQQSAIHPERHDQLVAQADAARSDHRLGDERAATAVADVTRTLAAHLATTPPSRSVLRGTATTADAWLQVDGAYEAIAERELEREQATAVYQAMGFADGFGRAGTSSLEGLRDLVVHPVDSAQGLWSFSTAAVTHPVRTSESLWHQVVDPFTDDWEHHKYGEAAGRGVEQLIELVVGAKGTTKVGRLTREAEMSRRAVKAAAAARVWTSTDPHVGELATWLDEQHPGIVKHVNIWVPKHDGDLREVDVDLGSTVVQVKGEHARGVLAQMRKTQMTTDRRVVAFAPTMPHGAYAHALREGFAVARTKQDLLNLVEELE